MATAKVFWSGRSQAVRLPKEFRVEGDEVRIRLQGHAFVLEPIPKDWAWLDKIQGPLDQDFIDAVNEELPQQERPELDRLDEIFARHQRDHRVDQPAKPDGPAHTQPKSKRIRSVRHRPS